MKPLAAQVEVEIRIEKRDPTIEGGLWLVNLNYTQSSKKDDNGLIVIDSGRYKVDRFKLEMGKVEVDFWHIWYCFSSDEA